jgi:hypothetical protein
MSALEETRGYIRQWRVYKAMAKDDPRYTRLAADFALIIRARIHRYGTTQGAS